MSSLGPNPFVSVPTRTIQEGKVFFAGHTPPVWLIDGIVQRGRLYACTSMTGHGKTAVWLFIACMIHNGRVIAGLDTFAGNVLILAGENPTDLEARGLAMGREFNIPLDRMPYVLAGGFPMTEEEADALRLAINAIGVDFALIIGDTAASFFPGDDDNSNVQAGAYARTLRMFTTCRGNPAVVALSHPIKHATDKTLLPRGGGAFLNELDANLTLWSDSPGEVTYLHWQGKIRGPDFNPIGWRLRKATTGMIDEWNRPEQTIVAEPMSDEAAAEQVKQALANEDVVLRVLMEQPGASVTVIARSAGWVDDDGTPQRWVAQRAMAILAAQKMIQQTRIRGPWEITEKGRAELEKDS